MNTRSRWSILGVGAFLLSGGCFDEGIQSEPGTHTRLGLDAACTQYCEAVMPCDGLVASPYRDHQDCQQTCLNIADQWESFGESCDTAHQEFIVCLSELSCGEAEDFLTYGPGEDPFCGEAEQRIMDCQG